MKKLRRNIPFYRPGRRETDGNLLLKLKKVLIDSGDVSEYNIGRYNNV